MAQPDVSPSAERNKQPILAHLQAIVGPQGRALEIASGTGQHVVWFAQHMPAWTWQPSEVHHGALYNIAVRSAAYANVLEPLVLDVRQTPWFAQVGAPAQFDLIFCANMLHIAPWEACAALMQGAARHLDRGGRLVTYGPYFEEEVSPAESNLAFDQSLRAHDPSWGIRQRADVESQAHAAGLHLGARHAMPANNLLLVWERLP